MLWKKHFSLLITLLFLSLNVVMQDTGCHIHFPDSNRGATNEKSNQVCFKYDYEFLLNCKRHIQLMLDIQ